MKSDNKHAISIYESILRNFGESDANDFANKFPLSKSADYIKKFNWASNVCDWLENRFSESEIKKIRMECACAESTKAQKTKKIYDNSGNIEEFCEKFNKEFAPGNALSHDGEAIYFTYPECYCSCVKRVTDNLSGDTKTWCLCTLGYAKALFSTVFSRDVEAELLESIKYGGSKCVVKIFYRLHENI